MGETIRINNAQQFVDIRNDNRMREEKLKKISETPQSPKENNEKHEEGQKQDKQKKPEVHIDLRF